MTTTILFLLARNGA